MFTRRMVAALTALALLPAFSASAAEDPDHPGLPAQSKPGTMSGNRTSGIHEVARAKQWINLPALHLVTFVEEQVTLKDPTCRDYYPYQETQSWKGNVNLVSPEGAAHPYGHAPVFTVRTAALGAVPVVARLSIQQVRDADGLPVPWTLSVPNKTFCPGLGPHAGPRQTEQHIPPAEFTGDVQIGVESLAVDGVDIQLTGQCRAERPTALKLASRDYYGRDPDLRPGETVPWDPSTTRFFTGPNGGLLEGTVDIPAFTGCTTADDDLSPVLTGLVSQDDNPVSVRVSQLRAACVPWAYDDSCTPMPEMDLPASRP
ncbi:hypothetical protein [Aeromicrobium massiliense]|uniref:hypothetical protein n=1 Tax=Aeromicrobium massiliense TaxID=1464554 RepID=UPI0005786130|nr:hypothetical protein [Aeromicrobium massiliense]